MNHRLVLTRLLVALVLTLGVLEDAAAAGGFRELTAQGVHYYRKKRLGPARGALEEAMGMPGGDRDYRTVFTLARVYYDLLILEKAFPTARKAVEVAISPEQRDESTRYLAGLEERFGGVTFRKAPEQKGDIKSGIIHLEDRGGLINPKKKELFEKLALRFRSTPVELPITLYLPFGSYSANRAPFEAQKGKVPEVELILYSEEEGGLSPWWLVGGGVVVAAAVTTTLLLTMGDEPEPETRMQLADVPFMDPQGE